MATDESVAPVESRAGPRKRAMVAEFTEKLQRATSLVFTDYRGRSVKELEEVRASLRGSQVDYLIVKNTLARRAATDAGKTELAESFGGPIGVAVGYDDPSVSARLINNYFKATKTLEITGGWAEGQLLNAASVKMLAELPSRDALLAQLAGTLQSPLTHLAGGLNSIFLILRRR